MTSMPAIATDRVSAADPRKNIALNKFLFTRCDLALNPGLVRGLILSIDTILI